MARKKLEPSMPPLSSWQDVDKSLAQMSECQRSITLIEAAMQEEIDAVKLNAKSEALPYRNQIAALEKQIQLFAETHRAELGDKKSVKLNFGACGFRKSTRVVLPRAVEKVQEIITRLRAANMKDCIIEPEPKINREALRRYSADSVAAIGANAVTVDEFWYELDETKLAEH